VPALMMGCFKLAAECRL